MQEMQQRQNVKLGETNETKVLQMPTSLPPHSLEAEVAVLGAILACPDSIVRITRLLPEDFYVPVHRAIYSAMQSLKTKGFPADILHVINEVEGQDSYTAVKAALPALHGGEGAFWISSIEFSSALIREKARQRKLVEIASQLSYDVMNGVSSKDAIASCQMKLLAMVAEDDDSHTVSFATAADEAFAQLEALNDGENAIDLGTPTGFYDLDAIMNCFPYGDLSIVGARGGMGKSTFALDVALRNAQAGVNTVYFSLEMKSADMAKKAFARLAAPRVPAELLFRKNALRQEHWNAISEALVQSHDVRFWINDNSRMSPSSIRNELIKISAKHGDIGLVVVDYTQLLQPDKGRGGESWARELALILQELRAIAKDDFGCSMLGIAQVKREVDSRNDKRPTIEDMGDSSAFEKEATTMVALYRDEKYNPQTTEKGIAEFIVLKNRFGETGTAKLLFDPRYGEFKNMPKYSH